MFQVSHSTSVYYFFLNQTQLLIVSLYIYSIFLYVFTIFTDIYIQIYFKKPKLGLLGNPVSFVKSLIQQLPGAS